MPGGLGGIGVEGFVGVIWDEDEFTGKVGSI